MFFQVISSQDITLVLVFIEASVSQPYLHARTPKNSCSYPEEPLPMKTFAGQETKTMLVVHGDCQLPDRSPRYFEVYLELFALFKNVYAFRDFHAETQTMFCRLVLAPLDWDRGSVLLDLYMSL